MPGRCLAPVNDMVFGPHGPGLISAGDDRTVRILNLELGSFVAVMDGHLDTVSTVAITSDSQTIASGSRDHTVRLWDRHDGQLLVLRGHTDRVNSVTFSPDEAQLASASSDGTVRIWNWRRRVDGARAPVPLLTTSEPSDTLAVALSPDGRRLALNTTSTSFAVHDIPLGQGARALRGQSLLDAPLPGLRARSPTDCRGAEGWLDRPAGTPTKGSRFVASRSVPRPSPNRLFSR